MRNGSHLQLNLMKSFPLVLIFFIVVAAVAWAAWAGHQRSNTVISSAAPNVVAAPSTAHPNVAHPAPSNLMISGEWREYHALQQKTLAENPELAAEYKAILNQMEAQQKALEAAMVKADPKVAPIVAKLDKIRQHNTLASSGSAK